MARQRSSRATPREFCHSSTVRVVALYILYASMIVASIEIRRALAEASVSGFACFTTLALMLGTDHRGTPSRRGVVSLRWGYAHRPRGLLRHEARPRAAKMNHLQYQLGGRCFLVALAAVFKLDGKTSSMEALACTVPAAHGMDTASNERARSEKLRSMFSV